MSSRIAAGIGLLLPRSYYQYKLSLQQHHWRGNPFTLANVRTIQPPSHVTKTYKEPGQTIRISSHHDEGIILFDGCVSTGFSTRYTAPWVGPFISPQEAGYILARRIAPDVVPTDFELRQRVEFLRRLGLSEDEIVAGQPLSRWYGLWLQQVA